MSDETNLSDPVPLLDATALREAQWEGDDEVDGFVAQIVDRCRRHGYCVVHNMLSEREIFEKKRDLERVLETVPLGRNDFEGSSTKRIYAIFNKTRVMDELATNPVVLGVAETLLNTPYFQLSSPTGIRIGSGESEQPLHRDDNKYPIPKPHPEVCLK